MSSQSHDVLRDQAIRAVQAFGCTCTPRVYGFQRDGDLMRLRVAHRDTCRYDPQLTFHPPEEVDQDALDRQAKLIKNAKNRVTRKANAAARRNQK